MKRLASIVLLAAILVGCTAKPQVKYVFYFIGDGMGINQVRGTEIYNEATDNGPKTLNFTQFPVLSFVNTNSASALVTDSAAAGTALATGVKTYNGAIGLDKDGKGVTSIGDWAKAAGVGVGLITTVGINHATPAAFYAHVDNRDKYDEICGESRKPAWESMILLKDRTQQVGIHQGKDESQDITELGGYLIQESLDDELLAIAPALQGVAEYRPPHSPGADDDQLFHLKSFMIDLYSFHIPLFRIC